MDIFDILKLLGGLSCTLFGMHVMSSGLERMSGGALERTLEKTTSNRVKAVLFGAGVTALIQSSSATTVMAVGFVNSGIMKLGQAIGIIMGANIGTTITAWVLSLTGIQGDALLLQMLKPSSFSPILAAIGVAMLLFSQKERRRNVGSILCGFAVLMFGMTAMTEAVKPLGEMPGFSSMMTRFSNPLLGVLLGAVFTGLIQSSAAAVGILQALSLTGGITYGAAIPIILGQNIGTCVTALMSCIGAGANAKRTAMVHLYFNLIGTFLFLGIFYVLDGVIGFTFVDQPLNPASIALIHTAFNLLATAVLLPFADGLGELAKLTIRDKKSDGAGENRLDERFLTIPAFALEQCRNVVDDMAALAQRSVITAMEAVDAYDSERIRQVLESEDQLDAYEDRLGAYLVKLSMRKLLPQDSRTVSEYLHMIGDFERIGDHAVNLTEVSAEMHDKRISFSDAAAAELKVFTSAVSEIVHMTVESFLQEDPGLASRIEPLEDVIDGLKEELRNRHIRRLQAGECTIELGFVLSDLLTNLERVSDHCSNIAACLIETGRDAFDMHSYLESVKSAGGDPAFGNFVKEYGGKYKLPPAQENVD